MVSAVAGLTGSAVLQILPDHVNPYQRRKINLGQVFAGQKVGVKWTADQIWLISFMEYDLGYFDDETCRLEPIEDPFGPRLSPMSPE